MAMTALITGASSGIGRELAVYHATKGGDVVIVARRKKALEELKAELEANHGVNVTAIAMDIGTPAKAQKLFDKVKALGINIDILINNAGFGGYGRFVERDLSSDQAMIDLNVSTLVTLTHLFMNDMIAGGRGGRLLHVASTAGFMPGPYQAVYFATKAFVKSFSQAIHKESRTFGITSTALCPGLVETEFVDTAKLEGTGLAKQKAASAKDVAKIGYDAMMKGKLIVINDRMLSFMLNWVVPLLPRRTVLQMVAKMQKKKQ